MKTTKQIFYSVLFFLFSLGLLGQAPEAFKYQAIARDSQGNILSNQQVTLLVELTRTSKSGEMIYSETHRCMTNEYGLINLEIGRGERRTGDFRDIDWGGDSYFIRISIDLAGGESFTEMGTTQLLSVPYALYAARSGSETQQTRQDLWASYGDDIFTGVGGSLPVGNAGIGIKETSAKLTVANSSGFTSTFFRASNNSGNALFLLRKSRGSILNPETVRPGDNIGQIRFEGYDGSEFITAGWIRSAVEGAVSSGNMPGNLLFATTPGPGGPQERMRITSGGNVGIGTVSPGATLHVIGDVLAGKVIATGGNSDNWNTAYGWGNHASAGYQSDSDTSLWDATRDWTNSNFYTKTNLQTSGQASVHWGNLTNVPTYDNYQYWTVYVEGTSQESIASTDRIDFQTDEGTGIDVTYNVTGNIVSFELDTTNDVASKTWVSSLGYLTTETDPQVGSNTTNYLSKWDGAALVSSTVYDNGNIGIGTTLPTKKVEVNGDIKAATVYASFFSSSSPLQLQTNGTTRIYADDNNGNVGIGTTQPEVKLEADGDAKFKSLVLIDDNGNKWRIRVNTSGALVAEFACGLSFTDSRDGKSYKTVQIGTQCWMAENLNVGTRIDGVNDQTDNSTLEKYCYDDLETSCDIYGGMYQWDEAMQYVTTEGVQGICPAGWHFPTDGEWTTLTTFLGGEAVAGGKMKETTWAHWISPNTGATNESGFTALPGGRRFYSSGSFVLLGNSGYFWSSTEFGASNALVRSLYYGNDDVYRNNCYKTYGYSIRCLQDVD